MVVGVLERLGGSILGVLTQDAVDEEAKGGAGDGLVSALIELIVELRAEARKAWDFANGGPFAGSAK